MVATDTSTDYEAAKDRAHELLMRILPRKDRHCLVEQGVIVVRGRHAVYHISPYTQTEMRDVRSGRCLAYGCLQLSIPAPTYDRMVAEYLLIKNAEDVYWKTANIFSRTGNEFGVATLFLIGLDIALLINLVLQALVR